MFTLTSFYKSKEWNNLINQIRLDCINDDGLLLCEYCNKPIIKAYDCIGHHKIELTNDNVNDYNISLNKNNIMLIHHKCHNIIHERFGYERQKKIYVVYGALCSGKSTWVQANAGVDDIVLDIDNIWQMITINDRYVKRDRLKQNVFGIRDCILEQIKMRVGKWKNAYIIGGYPLASDRVRLENLFNCEFIFIDETKEVCLQRSKDRIGWDKFVEDWFNLYSPH